MPSAEEIFIERYEPVAKVRGCVHQMAGVRILES
jgi:hypothetical protein